MEEPLICKLQDEVEQKIEQFVETMSEELVDYMIVANIKDIIQILVSVYSDEAYQVIEKASHPRRILMEYISLRLMGRG